jgi:hypothetical protein
MAHWLYVFAAASGPLGFSAWRYGPRMILVLVGALTKDGQRFMQCAEMVRLMRKDAKDISSYIGDGSPAIADDAKELIHGAGHPLR